MQCILYLRKSVAVFFEYDTPRYVNINSKKVGVLSRFLELIVLVYIIWYVLLLKKGYQNFSPVESAVVTKLKGVILTNYSTEELNIPNYPPELYNRIWDPTDFVVPSEGLERGGFFVMTNIVITPNQTRGICAEDETIPFSVCSSDEDCQLGRSFLIGNGVQTGKCVNSPRIDSTLKTCEIYAWCPVEQDILPLNGTQALLYEAEYFTVLIKNAIAFPRFGDEYSRRNVLEDSNTTYLQNCNYDPENDPFCPVFRLGDIVGNAGANFSVASIRGGVFIITIRWTCNLDYDFLKWCTPKYSFTRMDASDAKFAPGWNFRTAQYHEEGRRTLSKMYGIKVLIEVEGEAGKFGVVPLLLNVGAGLGIMGLATLVCDIIVLYCLKSRNIYKEKKYKTVMSKDAFYVNPAAEFDETQGTSTGTGYAPFDRPETIRRSLQTSVPEDDNTPVT